MKSASDGVGTIPTTILETSAVGPDSPRETGETEGGSGKAAYRDEDKEHDDVRTFPTRIIETLATDPESPRETGETEGGGGKAGDQDNDKENEESSGRRRRDSPT